MPSESELYKAQLQADEERAYQARVDARAYILNRWEQFNYTEEERDEILAALGLCEEDLSRNPGSYVARTLSRGGLGSSVGKAVRPRTPPTRGQ